MIVGLDQMYRLSIIVSCGYASGQIFQILLTPSHHHHTTCFFFAKLLILTPQISAEPLWTVKHALLAFSWTQKVMKRLELHMALESSIDQARL